MRYFTKNIITLSFLILSNLACSSSDGGGTTAPPGPTLITTDGTFTDARSRAVVNFTISWSVSGTSLSGTYEDDHYALTPVNLSGDFSIDTFDITATLPIEVSGVKSVDFTSNKSIFASDTLAVVLKDSGDTPTLSTNTNSLTNSSTVEIDDVIEDFVGAYSGSVLNQFGISCPADSTSLTAQIQEVQETDGAEIIIDITGVGPLTFAIDQLPNLENYYLAIAHTSNLSHTFVGAVFTNGETNQNGVNGSFYDNNNDCYSTVEFTQE